MRSILTLGCCLLALLVLERFGGFVDSAPTENASVDGGVGILAFGKGPLLRPAAYPGGKGTLDDGILIGDLILKFKDRRRGLRVAKLGRDLAFESFVNFDIATSEADAHTFAEMCRARPIGSVLVLAGFGQLEPGDELATETHELLEATFALLGSEQPPHRRTPCSWVMITVRGQDGWSKLAEAYSEETGVVVAFTLQRDLERYDGRGGELVIAEGGGLLEIPLALELASAQYEAGTAKFFRGAAVGGELRQSIRVTPAKRQPGSYSSVIWNHVPIRDRTTLQLGFGIWDGARKGSRGAVLAVLINGEEVDRAPLVSDPLPSAWINRIIDLERFAGEAVELEFRTYANGSAVVALWGNPVLKSARQQSSEPGDPDSGPR